MNNYPHYQIKFLMECVNIFLEEKTEWDSIKRVLADPNYL